MQEETQDILIGNEVKLPLFINDMLIEVGTFDGIYKKATTTTKEAPFGSKL